MRPSIVILAHPRSGSTTLRAIFFDCHELLSILNEPFNPTRRNGWGFDFLTHLQQPSSLHDILQLVSAHCSGTKHLLGQLTIQQDLEVFRHFESRYLLSRRNLLRAVVSCKVADQTKQWHRLGKPPVRNVQLEPIPLDQIQSFIDTIIQNMSDTRKIIEQESLSCTEVYYEDLFDQSINLQQRVETCMAIVAPHVRGMFSNDYVQAIAKRLDHGSNKVNSIRTYRLIPNYDEIHRNFSCDATGHLFDP